LIVFAYGFDLLELDGEDLRPPPVERRKAMLARSLDGIVLTEHLDGKLGDTMFRHACRMALRGSSASAATSHIKQAAASIGSR
jgi:ATP-dependent DNA ligase